MTLAGPIRTCVGCRQRGPQAGLIRFTMRTSGLAADGVFRAPGRGAYLHHDSDCWRAFARRRGPVRSLRLFPSTSDRDALVAALAVPAGESAR